MEMKVCAHVYFIVSNDNRSQKFPQALFPLHFFNLQTMQCMEVKLGTHVYLSVSMTTIDQNMRRALFPTSSLLKLGNHAMHGAETWYTCVFKYLTLALFPITTFSLLKLENHAMHVSRTWYECVL